MVGSGRLLAAPGRRWGGCGLRIAAGWLESWLASRHVQSRPAFSVLAFLRLLWAGRPPDGSGRHITLAQLSSRGPLHPPSALRARPGGRQKTRSVRNGCLQSSSPHTAWCLPQLTSSPIGGDVPSPLGAEALQSQNRLQTQGARVGDESVDGGAESGSRRAPRAMTARRPRSAHTSNLADTAAMGRALEGHRRHDGR